MLAVHHRALLLLAILSAVASPCAMAAEGEGAAGSGGAADTIPVPARLDDRAQGAVAAVLVATLGERFADPRLEIRLGAAAVEPAEPGGQVVSGLGQLRFEGGDDWLAFRYRTRYEPLYGTAGYPEISLGTDGEGDHERFVPNDAGLVAELEALVAGELESLPGAGHVFLQFDDINSMQSGGSFVHIQASGIADFGTGGSTPARIEALYDLQARAWRSIESSLAPNITPHGEGGTAGHPGSR